MDIEQEQELELEYNQYGDDYDFQQNNFNQNQSMTYERKQNHTELTNFRFHTLQQSVTNTKNIPKTFGNNFKKFMEMTIKNTEYFIKNPLPIEMKKFLQKKVRGKQADYGLVDFRQLLENNICREYLKFYMKNCAYLDLIHSNRIKNAVEQIQFIEHYLNASDGQQQLECNRIIQQVKSNAQNNQTIQVIQQSYSKDNNDIESNQELKQNNDQLYNQIDICFYLQGEEENKQIKKNNHELLRKDSFEESSNNLCEQ